SQGPGSDLDIPRESLITWRNAQLYCPNCGHKMSARDTDQTDANPIRRADGAEIGTIAPVHYGDRILVLKYLYLFEEPRRWDVVVFKSPDDRSGGEKYADNYIKRLIGKPFEQIMILDGDIYVREKGSDHFEIQTKPPVVQD